MMRSSAIALLGLLFFATALFTAALFTQSFAYRYCALGILLGQIVLASAGIVLLRGMLALRLMFLGLILFYATTWICLTSFLNPLQVALPLIGAALLSAAWCAALQFLGWRVVGIHPHPLPGNEGDESQRAGQFSLATIMLTTAIVAVYLGLLRASGIAWSHGLEFLMMCLLLVAPGCLLLHATARARWAWLPSAILIPLLYLFLAGLIGWGVWDRMIGLVTRALTAELIFVGVVLAVLRVAGIRLAWPETPARNFDRTGASAGDFLAPRRHST